MAVKLLSAKLECHIREELVEEAVLKSAGVDIAQSIKDLLSPLLAELLVAILDREVRASLRIADIKLNDWEFNEY